MIVVLDQFGWHTDGSQEGFWAAESDCLGLIDLASAAQIEAATPEGPRGWHVAVYKEIPKGLSDRGGVVIASEDVRESQPDGKTRDIVGQLLGYIPQGDFLSDWIVDLLTIGADPANEAGPGLLIPTAQKRLEVWLAGAKISDAPFAFSADEYSQKLISVIKADLEAVRIDALDGKLVNPVTKQADDEYHLRIADAILEKYAGKDSAAKDALFVELKPDTWEVDEQPKPHATTITDNFNRSDASTLGTSSEGWSWTDDASANSAAWRITSNTGGPTTDHGNACSEMARAESDLSSSDTYAQAVGVTMGGAFGGAAATAVRCSNGSSNSYRGGCRTDTGIIYKMASGSATLLYNNAAGAGANGDTIRMEASGSSITLKKNGSTITTVTDSTITSGVRCGVAGRTTSVTLDSFSAGDLGGGSPYTLAAGVGSFSLSGQAAGLRATRKVTAALGTFSLSGQAAGLRADRKVTAAVGAFSLSGQAAGLRADRRVAAAVGTFTVSGQAVGLRATRSLVASVGTFILSGQAATLTKTGSYTLTASAGAFTLSGQAAALTTARRVVAGVGTFTFTGQPAILIYSGFVTPAGDPQAVFQLPARGSVFVLDSGGVFELPARGSVFTLIRK